MYAQEYPSNEPPWSSRLPTNDFSCRGFNDGCCESIANSRGQMGGRALAPRRMSTEPIWKDSVGGRKSLLLWKSLTTMFPDGSSMRKDNSHWSEGGNASAEVMRRRTASGRTVFCHLSGFDRGDDADDHLRTGTGDLGAECSDAGIRAILAVPGSQRGQGSQHGQRTHGCDQSGYPSDRRSVWGRIPGQNDRRVHERKIDRGYRGRGL